ncbi:MAG: PRC-barrel domain-containing protein [Bacillota bacterium]|nr:PRC-barrel domain-containing protein [Bacillota bacterium]MDW7683263.1 PRC-barrel domain-containing protein [Bacillota bacterium]
MRFSREITGMPVIHAATGREVGKVSEWFLDNDADTVIAFVAEGSGWLPQRRVFSFKDIIQIGKDAVFVSKEGSHVLGDPPEADGRPTQRVFGKRVLSGSGDDLGVVEDVLFAEDTGRITGWRLSAGLIDDILYGRQVVEPQVGIDFGEDVLILRDWNEVKE